MHFEGKGKEQLCQEQESDVGGKVGGDGDCDGGDCDEPGDGDDDGDGIPFQVQLPLPWTDWNF